MNSILSLLSDRWLTESMACPVNRAFQACGAASEEEERVMLQGKSLMLCAILALLAGCAEPPAEEPKANGAYLVIDGQDAWAVLISDGRRIEERGTVRDAIRLPRAHSAVAASYVIDTPNCGRLQWLTESRDGAAGSTRLLAADGDAGDLSACRIRTALSRMWTALDYSG
ncbi:hypothetical protein [Pseudomonas panipatensis]